MPFAEGASINRSPMFGDVNYALWKIRMKIFMESIDLGIWDAVVSGPFVPMQVVKDETVKSLGLSGVKVKRRRLNMTL